MKNVVLASLMVAALMVATPAAAFHPEIERYARSVSEICSTGITPEVVHLYGMAVKAADAAGYGAGRQSNFAGPIVPEVILSTCMPSAGE